MLYSFLSTDIRYCTCRPTYFSFLLSTNLSLFSFFIIVLVICIGKFVEVDVTDLLCFVRFF